MSQEREFLVIFRVYSTKKADAVNRVYEMLNEGGDADIIIDFDKITEDEGLKTVAILESLE